MIDILVVDHSAGNPLSVRNLLPDIVVAGFNIKFVMNYRDILEAFQCKAYDVCLIDSASGNGLRLIAQARAIGNEAAMILVTANDPAEAIRAFRNGVADCLIRENMTLAKIERSVCCVVEEARITSSKDKCGRRYQALIDNADDIIYTHYPQGNFTSMNRIGERMIGYAQEECLNLSVTQIVMPRCRALASQMIQQTLNSQSRTSYEVEILTKHDRILAVGIETHLIYHRGKAVEVQSIARKLQGTRMPTD